MLTALDVHRCLLGRDVPHEIIRLPHHQRVASAADLPDALGVPAGSCLQVRCYLSDQGGVAVLLPVGTEPEPRAVLAAAHRRWVRTASTEEVNELTDFRAELVCPVGLPAAVLVLADSSLASAQVLYCPAGEAGVVLGIRAQELLRAVDAHTAPLVAA